MTVSIQKLKEQQNEATARCVAARSSIVVAQSRLNDVLTTGRDTNKAREVLKKCEQLAKEAESQRGQVEAQLEAYYNVQDDKQSSAIVSVINANIAELLAPFDLNKYKQEV